MISADERIFLEKYSPCGFGDGVFPSHLVKEIAKSSYIAGAAALDELRKPSKDAEEAATADEVRLYRQQNPDVGMHAAKLAVEKNRSRVLYTDAEEAAREHARTEGDNGNAEISFLAGWQAKESREAELMSLLERCIKFIEMPSSYAFPKALASELIADFEKMKSAPSVEPKTPIPGK